MTDTTRSEASIPAPGQVSAKPKLGRSDWVNCPICGESDMRKQIDPDADNSEGYIYCVNTNCGSNGGDNFCGLQASHTAMLAAAPRDGGAKRREALDELAAESQRLGLYDATTPPTEE